jgi:DNA-directed RNA polymerase specialized sigma24 family protein
MEIGPRNPERRRRPSDEATVKRLAGRYNEGLSIRDIAREMGWSYGTVYQRLSMAQVSGLVVLRPRGGVSGPRRIS